VCKEIAHRELPAGDKGGLISSDRVFCLLGIARGSAVIQARGGTAAPVDLEVDVKFPKIVRISFNFVKDTAHHQTRRVPAQAAAWVKTMNYIYNGQANVFFISKAARWVTVSKNMGGTITTTKTGVGEEADIYPLADTSADVNVFLVWNMDITDDPADEDAFAEGTRIIFEDTAGRQVAETIAHEVGHTLGLADQYTTKRELMYGYTDVRGIDLPKPDVNTINP
jgi:hypothetical protein